MEVMTVKRFLIVLLGLFVLSGCSHSFDSIEDCVEASSCHQTFDLSNHDSDVIRHLETSTGHSLDSFDVEIFLEEETIQFIFTKSTTLPLSTEEFTQYDTLYNDIGALLQVYYKDYSVDVLVTVQMSDATIELGGSPFYSKVNIESDQTIQEELEQYGGIMRDLYEQEDPSFVSFTFNFSKKRLVAGDWKLREYGYIQFLEMSDSLTVVVSEIWDFGYTTADEFQPYLESIFPGWTIRLPE
jgi:hypothetical protein